MVRLLDRVFGLVCGQEASHVWAPGGELLPLCERCSGIYAGALLGFALHAFVRPPRGAMSSLFHALLVLQIAPAGLDLFPQGPLLRTLSGVLFGVGLAYFLGLGVHAGSTHLARSSCEGRRRAVSLRYYAGMALGMLSLLALARSDAAPAGRALSWLCFGGLAMVTGLAAIDLAIAARALLKRDASASCKTV